MTTKTLKYFLITNTTSGHDLGVFGGVDEAEAIDLMLDDAGVEDGDVTGLDDIKAIPVDDANVTAEDVRVIAELRARYGYDS